MPLMDELFTNSQGFVFVFSNDICSLAISRIFRVQTFSSKAHNISRSDIEFKTIDHVTLRGWIFKPTGAQGKLPCLVMSHGLTCLKEMHLDTLAERLTATPLIACLVYDHRGFGTSDQKDNEHRSEIIPAHQNSDLQDAITYAQSREDIDAARIGVWGYSYSGGHSLWVGAIDRRVKAVIAVAPFTNGEIISNNTRSDFEDALDDMFAQERLSRAAGDEPGRIPVVVKNQLDTAILPHAESYEFFSPWAENIGWKNDLTIRRHYSLEGVKTYFPASRNHKIAPTPLLMHVPKKDIASITDAMLEDYSRARELKEIQILPGGHFSMFVGDEFEMLVAREEENVARICMEVPMKPCEAYGRKEFKRLYNPPDGHHLQQSHVSF
ncbi:DltD N-terminal domain protein [Aureobasidium sp. EXF-8845]|nr:DltD N-terminal domain protein [Aureobasidium sp. EXF-8845]KAI4849455.1 DltD N-terminal domain protein [Aureobasidium sp. EXF-8846]